MKSCENCLHSLFPYGCRLNVEYECGDGEFECWEAADVYEAYSHPKKKGSHSMSSDREEDLHNKIWNRDHDDKNLI